jgi:hypothetical protein
MQRAIEDHKRVRRPAWLLTAFWLSIAIAVAVVVRRLIALTHPGQGNSPTAALDTAFASHAALTAAHIIPAALFVILSAAVLVWRIQKRPVHWAFFVLGAITGVTAFAMNAFPVGGRVEQWAVWVFGSWFLVSLARAFWHFAHGEQDRQRRWMTRAVGILLGIATTRPVMGIFFATSRFTHMTPDQFFGIAFWIGFSLNTVAVELWLRARTRNTIRAPKGRALASERDWIG